MLHALHRLHGDAHLQENGEQQAKAQQGQYAVKGALERPDFVLQLVKISGHEEGEFLAAEELEFLFDAAELLCRCCP